MNLITSASCMDLIMSLMRYVIAYKADKKTILTNNALPADNRNIIDDILVCIKYVKE